MACYFQDVAYTVVLWDLHMSMQTTLACYEGSCFCRIFSFRELLLAQTSYSVYPWTLYLSQCTGLRVLLYALTPMYFALRPYI